MLRDDRRAVRVQGLGHRLHQGVGKQPGRMRENDLDDALGQPSTRLVGQFMCDNDEPLGSETSILTEGVRGERY